MAVSPSPQREQTSEGSVAPFPLERRSVPQNSKRTVSKAALEGRAFDLCPLLNERRRAAYEAKRAEENAYDFAATALRTLAWCLPEEGRIRFREAMRLSVVPGHSSEYRRAVAKLLWGL